MCSRWSKNRSDTFDQRVIVRGFIMQIGVVDYGASNIFSVLRALTFLGADAKIISKREDFNSIDKIILPGQGSMGACIENLKKNELFESLKNTIV